MNCVLSTFNRLGFGDTANKYHKTMGSCSVASPGEAAALFQVGANAARPFSHKNGIDH